MRELWIVPGDRVAARLSAVDRAVETRTRLRTKLATALLPSVRFAPPRETRLVLGMALFEQRERVHRPDPGRRRPNAAQMDLFGTVDDARPDPLLAALRTAGGASWVRAITAIDRALGHLRLSGATAEHLDRVAEGRGVAATRARTLAAAMRVLDDTLGRSGARDERLLGPSLAAALASVPPDRVAEIVGADRVTARFVLGWSASDLGWWRALDEKLARRGGFATILLPSFDRPLEGGRESDPLEIIVDDVARGLDGAPSIEPIAQVLGDLAGGAPEKDAARSASVRLVRPSDALAQARTVAALVSDALAHGASVERIAVAFASPDDKTLLPIRRALDDAGIVVHEARGEPPSEASVVASALLALETAESFDRAAVARLLSSGYVDAARLLESKDPLASRRAVERIARTLDTHATAAGESESERFVRTATRQAKDDASVPAARRIAEVLARGGKARTRSDRVRAARVLFAELGIGARAGRGGLDTFGSDAAPEGVAKAERLAIARDARAWEALLAALDAYEGAALRSDAATQEVSGEIFRLEVRDVLDAGASLPGAGRAGAVRLARLADLVGDELDLVIVVDANDGALPSEARRDALISDALADAVGKASRGAFAPATAAATRARELAALAVVASDAASIVVVAPAEDGTGAPASPSFVFDVLRREGVAVVGGPEDVLPAREAGGSTSPVPEAGVLRRAARERAREAFFLDPDRPASELAATLAPNDTVRALVTNETGGAGRALAVTALERFAKCAFMGYAYVVLAARDVERQSEMPDAREEGNLGHEALAAAFVATRDLWPRRPRNGEAILARGLAAADGVLAAAASHAALRAVVRLRVRESVRGVLLRALEDEAWDFAFAEQAFGDAKLRGAKAPVRDPTGDDARRDLPQLAPAEPAWPALTLEDAGVRLALRGTIDRVDRAHLEAMSVGARVVDYKRSKNTVRGAGASLGETALQVPLYACVASRSLDVPATGGYMAIQARDLAAEGKPSGKAQQRMDALVAREGGALAEIERRALALVEDVRGGRFAPVPADESECTYCGVSGGCRKPRFAMKPRDEEGT